jgi:hypothetical protein
MANVKISQLPSATTPLAGTEVLPIVQGSTTKKVSVAGLFTSPVMVTPALGTPSAVNLTNATNLPLTTGVTGVLPVANGGNGTATPSLVAGANVTITGTWPNQTIASTGGGGGGVTSFSAGTTGLTPATATTGAVTLAGTLAVANGGTGTATPSLVAGTNVSITGTWPNQTINSSGGGGSMVYPGAGIPLSTGSAWGTSYSTTGTGDVVLSTSPTLVTPLLGTPTSGNFSTGTFTWPTFNQNTTGTAANITATSNSTLTTLSALSLPGSQVSGNISGNAANVTGTVAIANGGSGQTTAQLAMNAFAGAVTSGSYLRGNGTNVVMATIQAADVPTLNQNTTGTAAGLSATLAVASGGTGVTTSTGSGSVVLSTSPTLVTPVLGTPTSGTLSNCTVDGTNEVGFKNIPQNSQSAAYTLVLADAGKHILHPSTDANARTFTIPANSSVAYPIGTAVTFVNMTSQVVTIAITSDTLTLSPAGTTGSRSLAQYGSATALKIGSTQWLISGSGLT